jgi:hypothetical protein
MIGTKPTEKSIGALLGGGLNDAIVTARLSNDQRYKLHAQPACRRLRFCEEDFARQTLRIDDCHAGESWDEFFGELQKFSAQLFADGRQPRDVSPRPREAGDEPLFDRIGAARHHDRDRDACFLRGPRRPAAIRNDKVNFEARQDPREAEGIDPQDHFGFQYIGTR